MTSKASDVQIRNEQSLMTLEIKNTNVVNDVLPLKEEGGTIRASFRSVVSNDTRSLSR